MGTNTIKYQLGSENKRGGRDDEGGGKEENQAHRALNTFRVTLQHIPVV